MRHAFSIKLNVNKNDKNIDQGLIVDRCEKGGYLMGVSGGGAICMWLNGLFSSYLVFNVCLFCLGFLFSFFGLCVLFV